jgi:hypothetical protein
VGQYLNFTSVEDVKILYPSESIFFYIRMYSNTEILAFVLFDLKIKGTLSRDNLEKLR